MPGPLANPPEPELTVVEQVEFIHDWNRRMAEMRQENKDLKKLKRKANDLTKKAREKRAAGGDAAPLYAQARALNERYKKARRLLPKIG